MSVSVLTSVRTNSTLEIVCLQGYSAYNHHRVVVVYLVLRTYFVNPDACE